MNRIEKTHGGWRINAGGLEIHLNGQTGDLNNLKITAGKKFLWSNRPGGVYVRDDLIGKTFRAEDIQKIEILPEGDTLTIRKAFNGAPWLLTEVYRAENDCISWNAELNMDRGDFRSCRVSMDIPWPDGLPHRNRLWAAKENMPSATHRFASISLEYGEITSGIIIPALCAFREKDDAGIMLAMPFDFMTPRFSFNSVFREPNLEVRYDWLALAEKKPAKTSLLMRGTGGNWRPALGWLYERFKDYFEPRSKLIHNLWGGHVSGGCNVSEEDVNIMASLGLKWHEVHCHFPAYGNYHPEGMDRWRSGHARKDTTQITVEMIRNTIRNLHKADVAALPYIQVSGDGDEKMLGPKFESSRIRDYHGELTSAWPQTHLMNSDPSLPFGKDMVRQIKGMAARYPEMDGVFLDQACYNFLDTAHHDGITAVNNRPAYMTGFNYLPHLELLSSLLHPEKAIIANGPFGVGIMKYIDAFMAEGQGWLCDHLQYYGLAKPLFFLVYDKSDRDIEGMFRSCVQFGAGYSSYAQALPSKDLYDLYTPVLEKLFGRRWVFDPDPLQLPTGFKGNLFHGRNGSLLASAVSSGPRYAKRTIPNETLAVNSSSAETAQKVILHEVGKEPVEIKFGREKGGIQFDIPGDTVAAVAEIKL